MSWGLEVIAAGHPAPVPGALPRIPVYGPAQSLAEAAGTFSGPVSLATPGEVLDLS